MQTTRHSCSGPPEQHIEYPFNNSKSMHVIVMPRHALEILFRPLSLDHYTYPCDAQRKIKVRRAFRRPA